MVAQTFYNCKQFSDFYIQFLPVWGGLWGRRYLSPDTKWRGLFSHGFLASLQLIISALHVNELVVGASLYDASMLHDHDAVRVLDRGKSVSYDK